MPINDNTNYSVATKSSNPEQSRIDRIQQLRAEHQRRHLERSGKYIPEERDINHYESDLHPVCIMLCNLEEFYGSAILIDIILNQLEIIIRIDRFFSVINLIPIMSDIYCPYYKYTTTPQVFCD